MSLTSPLSVTSLAALAHAEAGRPSAHREVDILSEVAPADAYHRRLPLILDADAVAPALSDLSRQYFTADTQSYDARYLARINNALVVGQGAVVTANGTLMHDSVAEFVNQGRVPDGLTRKDAKLQVAGSITQRIKAPSILLKRPWYRNFGHWLVDNATMLALLPTLPLPPDYRIIVGRIADPSLKTVVDELVQTILPGVKIVVHDDADVFFCEELLYLSPLHVPPLFKLPAGIDALRERLLTKVARGTTRSRLFVSRRNATFRNVENEGELIGVAERFGFTVLQPERMSFFEQVQQFANAEIVVGVKGAALTNIMFCDPSAAAIVLSPADFIDPFYWDIAGQRQLSYCEIFGALTTARDTGFNDFVIPPEKLQDAIERSLACSVAGYAAASGADTITPPREAAARDA
jgi:capsular polysaccharide biosynthesis protein